MWSGLSSLKPPSSCYLLTAALVKLQDDRILRLLAENRGVVKLQIKHTQMGRRPHLTNQSSTTLWLSTLEWDGHAGRLNGEVTIKHLNIRRDMMGLHIMGKHSKRRKSWLDDAASRSTEMSFPKPLNSGVHEGHDAVKASGWIWAWRWAFSPEQEVMPNRNLTPEPLGRCCFKIKFSKSCSAGQLSDSHPSNVRAVNWRTQGHQK